MSNVESVIWVFPVAINEYQQREKKKGGTNNNNIIICRLNGKVINTDTHTQKKKKQQQFEEGENQIKVMKKKKWETMCSNDKIFLQEMQQ